MKKSLNYFLWVAAFSISMAACSTLAGGTQVPSPDQVSTVVALTFQAMTPQGVMTEAPPALLPHSLYFLAPDSRSIDQVYRMERDGQTVTQLTFESVSVSDYDVSQADGRIAYEIGTTLLLADADGSNRHVFIDGNSHPDLRGFYKPVFSPDGQILAYSQAGLILHTFSTGVANHVLQDHPLGGSLPPETYHPDQFSPDGTKLLLEIGHPPDSPATAGIYSLDTQVLIQFAGENESLTCCTMYGGAEWATDSSSLYVVASQYDSSSPFGVLWKVNAASGAVTTLSPAVDGEGKINLPYKPFPGPDGWLYYFFLNYTEPATFDRPTFQVVRSTPENTAARSVMLQDAFMNLNQALWSPDASFVLVALSPGPEVMEGGQAILVPLDGRPQMELVPFARLMKWGP